MNSRTKCGMNLLNIHGVMDNYLCKKSNLVLFVMPAE